jgi:plastocyanin/LysM repeat protein
MILADLNQIPYGYDEDEGTFTIGGKPDVSEDGVGLLPGAELQLPEGAVYVLRPGDTVDYIAEIHAASPDEVVDLNSDDVVDDDTSAELDAGAKLQLPENPTYVVQEGDTAASIAEQHGIEQSALEGADLAVGSTIELPGAEQYTIQAEDTLATVAIRHGMQESELASLNGLEPNTPIRPEVVFELPDGATYVVQGQSLDDIRQSLGGVSADQLAQAQEPPVEADHVYAVGTNLIMPPDAYGSAPPDAINLGTACVQHAVPQSAYEQITGGGSSGAPDAPEEFSDEVEITSGANDFTVIADGESSGLNEGVVKVAVGTTITFTNNAGFHTITVNGDTEVPEFGPTAGDTYEREFSEAGEYEITCDIHPDMLAWVFAEEPQ